MKWRRLALLLLGFFVITCASGVALYNRAFSEGSSAGLAAGLRAGYTSGNQDGYDRGYYIGKADAVAETVQASQTYILRDPTYAEAVAFLQQDKTDQNSFIAESYVCSHFARDVVNNAHLVGLRTAFVEIRYPFFGHSLIAFNTTDRGLVYFEPQNDQPVKPVIGTSYYPYSQSGLPIYAAYSDSLSYDDTVVDILVIW